MDGIKAKLVFEDGRVFQGFSFGSPGETFGEVVFNTSMAGYQEILTDPSYNGQLVTMTYPLIGNYGVNEEDVESRKIFVEGFIVKEYNHIPSNWRSQKNLDAYLRENNIVGIHGVDTRAITRHIRLAGAMKAVVSTIDESDEVLTKKAKESPCLIGRDLVREVSSRGTTEWNKQGKYNVVVVDCGVKFSILRQLGERDCHVTLVGPGVSAKEILQTRPDGVLFSNGPGDPQGAPYVAHTVKELLGKLPVFGICLGHQMIALALGCTTYKLKFGHHGGNQPVKDIHADKVCITSQNHSFCVNYSSVRSKGVDVTHINLNDNTVEGMESDELNFFSVQFHPEAGPGPNDAAYLFDKFLAKLTGSAGWAKVEENHAKKK
ncbi:MAG: glutamine-hydrolyzing carbamoyl-phosphate synthase small subunit [Candidatus Omnitrophota bacterium]